MSRATIVIRHAADRALACRWVAQVPFGSRIEFKASKRTLPQNDRFWAMLSDVARQLPWHGVKLGTSDWRYIFLDALKREVRIVPNIAGTGFVNLGRSSSDLSKDEMSQLLALIEAFGAEHGVVFHDPAQPNETPLAPSHEHEKEPA